MKIFGRIAAIVGTVLFAVAAVLIANGVGLWERADANATPTLYPKTALQFQSSPSPVTESKSAIEIITPTSTLVVVEATPTATTAPATATSVPVLATETSVSAATAEPTPTYSHTPVTISKTTALRSTPDVGLEMYWGDLVEISYPNPNGWYRCDAPPYISGAPYEFVTLESFCPDPDTKTVRFRFPYQGSVHMTVFNMIFTERLGWNSSQAWVLIYVPRYGFN